jgi:hypothetical protein
MDLEVFNKPNQYHSLVDYNKASGVFRPQQFVSQSQNYQARDGEQNATKKKEEVSAKKKAAELLIKKKAVDKYMMYYDELMKNTIRRNNDSIYQELFQFLSPSETVFMDPAEGL